METVAEVTVWLSRQAKLSWRNEGAQLTIDASSPNGFSVWILSDADEWTVGFGEGWHGHFESEAEAVTCFLKAISGQVREETWRRGDFPYHWTAQIQNEGEWKTVDTVGLFAFPSGDLSTSSTVSIPTVI